MNLVTESGFCETPINLNQVLHYAALTSSMSKKHEGEQLINGHCIVYVGIRKLTNNCIEVFGTCLECFTLKLETCEITILIHKSEDINWQCHCTCKFLSGHSGSNCKHIFAILLYFVK